MLDDEKPNKTPNETPNEPTHIPEEPTFPVDRREKSEGEIPEIE